LSTECDNCRQIFQSSAVDCTRMSIEILRLVSELEQNNLTLPYIIDILRGVNNKSIRNAGHHHLRAYNSGQQLTRLGELS
jgi:superfamily II DNA helicase RecQ